MICQSQSTFIVNQVNYSQIKIFMFQFMCPCFIGKQKMTIRSNNIPRIFRYLKDVFLTLFWVGGGHYGPDDLERPRCFRRVRATTTKIHDFVSVYVWMVPWKSFLGFVFKIFEKRKIFFLMISIGELLTFLRIY